MAAGGLAIAVRPVKALGERRRAPAALSERRFRLIAESADDVIWTLDPRTLRFTYVSPAVEKLRGLTQEEAMAERLDQALTPSSYALVSELLEGWRKEVDAGHGRGLGRRIVVLEQPCKDGSTRHVEVSVSLILDAAGNPFELLGVTRDITQRRVAEQALQESEARFRALFENSADGILIIDAETMHILDCNPAAAAQNGWRREELVGQHVDVLHTEEMKKVSADPAGIAELLRRKGSVRLEGSHRRKDGSVFPLEISMALAKLGDRLVFLGMDRDITERKEAEAARRRMEAQLLNTQKLESLGALAGGIAHDFNNLLGAILGNASFAAGEVPPGGPVRASLDDVVSASKRAAELVQQMMAYGGQIRLEPRLVDLSEAVQSIDRIISLTVPKKVALSYDLVPGVGPVRADPARIHQVVLSLVANAAEAIGDAPGSIGVSTGTGHRERTWLDGCVLGEGLAEGIYASLRVSDTGCGMDDETRSHLFEPFFTTKFAGRGLGLAAVLGIVRAHGGAIRVESAVGRGTTATVLLPVVTAEATGAGRARQGEGRVVLIVDDEEELRRLGARLLTRMGHRALVAADGEEAVGLFQKEPAAIDCVIVDATMPRLNGEETVRAIRRLRSDVPVIVTSGYPIAAVRGRFDGLDVAGFLHKPFDVAGFEGTVLEALGAKGPSRRQR